MTTQEQIRLVVNMLDSISTELSRVAEHGDEYRFPAKSFRSMLEKLHAEICQPYPQELTPLVEKPKPDTSMQMVDEESVAYNRGYREGWEEGQKNLISEYIASQQEIISEVEAATIGALVAWIDKKDKSHAA